MKDVLLDEIQTLIHGDKIIIPLDNKLTQLVNSKKIIFQSMIKDNKFVLVGPIIGTKTHKDTASDNGAFDLD